MIHGHGPSGIIGSTLNDSTLAIWAFSHSSTVRILNDLKEMKQKLTEIVIITHKKEGATRIKEETADKDKIRETLSRCIVYLTLANTHNLGSSASCLAVSHMTLPSMLTKLLKLVPLN